MVVGLLGNKSSDSNRLTLVTPKSENDVRLQATLGNQNPIGLPVGVVRILNLIVNQAREDTAFVSNQKITLIQVSLLKLNIRYD